MQTNQPPTRRRPLNAWRQMQEEAGRALWEFNPREAYMNQVAQDLEQKVLQEMLPKRKGGWPKGKPRKPK